jgi:hypothetical protein
MNRLKLLKAGLEAKFTPSLSFLGKQGDIGGKIWKVCYPDWETGVKILHLKTYNKKNYRL